MSYPTWMSMPPVERDPKEFRNAEEATFWSGAYRTAAREMLALAHSSGGPDPDGKGFALNAELAMGAAAHLADLALEHFRARDPR